MPITVVLVPFDESYESEVSVTATGTVNAFPSVSALPLVLVLETARCTPKTEG
jgi:hypothetical protein